MVETEYVTGINENPLGPGNEIIAAYTQGKVATKSLVAALEGMYPDTHIWDVRRGLMEGVIEHESIRGTRPNLLSEDRQFAQLLLDNTTIDLRLASIVREPVGIAVSSLFYNFIPRNTGIDINEVEDVEIIDRLVKGESFSSPSFHLDWFDIEVKPLTGIDVYASKDFPVTEGYAEYRGTNGKRTSELLVMRLEDLQRVASVALSGFFSRQAPSSLPRNNVGAEAAYGPRYEAFKNSARLPEEWVMWQLDSRYAQYFYSKEELNQHAQRWLEGIKGNISDY